MNKQNIFKAIYFSVAFIVILLILAFAVNSIDCATSSCAQSDYKWSDFSNPTYNGGNANNGDYIINYNYSYRSIGVPYNNTFYNTSPVSIKVTYNDHVFKNMDFGAYYPDVTTGCVDFYMTSLSDGNYGWTISGTSETPFLKQHFYDCGGDYFCYLCGAFQKFTVVRPKINNWFTFCYFWNGTINEFLLYNGSDTETVKGKSCAVLMDNPFYNVSNQFGVSSDWATAKIYVDNIRFFKSPVLNMTPPSYTDNLTPGYSDLINNNTHPSKGDIVKFEVSLTDNIGLSSYVFSDNQTGNFINKTFTYIAGTSYNAAQIINITVSPAYICGKFWFNDTSNNKNTTALSCVGSIPKIMVYSPLDNSIQRGTPLFFNYSVDYSPNSCMAFHNITGSYTLFYNLTMPSVNTSASEIVLNFSYENGAKGFFRFENSSTNTAVNIIPTKQNGTISGATFVSSKGTNGTGNYALNFDGSDDYVNFAGDNFIGDKNITICAWFYPRTAGEGSLGQPITNGQTILYTATSNWILTSDGASTFNSCFPISYNKWAYICFQRNSAGTLNCYNNGTLMNTIASGTPLAATINFTLGGTSARNYDGIIDELVIVNYTLSTENITKMYNKGFYSYSNSSYSTSGNATINSTLTPYFIYSFNFSYPNNTREDYKFYLTCTDGGVFNSSITSFHFDSDIYAPSIEVTSPNPAYNDTYSYVWINITSSEISVCALNNTNFNLSYTNLTVYKFVDNSLGSGFYSVKISCTDLSNNTGEVVVYFTKDIVYPFIYTYSPIDNYTYPPSQKIIYFNASFVENIGLYDYNITLFCSDDSDFGESEYFNDSALISGTYYNYSYAFLTKVLPNSTTCRLLFRTCDSHTDTEIKDFEVTNNGNSINFKAESLDLIIESMDGAFSTFAEKTSDRYTFGFSYQEIQTDKNGKIIIPPKINAIIPTEKHYKVMADDIVYLPKSSFKGHFVISSRYWLDFEGQGKVSVSKEENYYIVSVTENTDVTDFKSIGELNCIEKTVLFSRGVPSVYHPFGIVLDTDSIGSMIFLFSLIILYLGVIISGFYFNNFGLISFGFLIGIILGLLLGSISIILLLIFILINSAILIQYMRTHK